MSRETLYHEQLHTWVHKAIKLWIDQEAARRSTVFHRVPSADVVREALNEYIVSRTTESLT